MNYFKIFISAAFVILVIQLTPAYADDNSKIVADELNQLYQRTTPCDNNEPAYYCSGIILHGEVVPDEDNSLPSWYLPGYRNVGSFSYLRKDITATVGEAVYINTGFILTPADQLEAKKEFSYKLYCEYPADGASVGDASNSCHLKQDDFYTICGDEIQTVNDYAKKYFDNLSSDMTWDRVRSCSFLSSKERFDLSMQLHKYIYKDNSDKTSCKENKFCRTHNELIISTWDIKNVPDVKVPILAFYAVINDTSNPMFKESGRTSSSKAEIEQLFKDADAFSKATNYARRIPVVTLDMNKLRNGDKNIFAPARRSND